MDELRDHIMKNKQHHQGTLGGKSDPCHKEEFCHVHVLEDETFAQRKNKTDEGHATKLREVKQPTTGEVQQQGKLKSDKINTPQLCKFTNPAGVEVATNREQFISMERQQGGLIVETSKHERQLRKKRKNIKVADNCQLSRKSHSYLELNQLRVSQEASEFQEKATQNDLYADIDEKTDGTMMKITNTDKKFGLKLKQILRHQLRILLTNCPCPPFPNSSPSNKSLAASHYKI